MKILYKVIALVNSFFNSGHHRTVLAKKNIAASYLIKGVLLVVGFLKVPILLDYIGTSRYGLIVTILSLVTWINYFDFGLGHGLRNKLAISIAVESDQSSKKIVSTAYIAFSFLVGAIFVIVFPITFYVDWSYLLGYPEMSSHKLHVIIITVFVSFLLRFVLNLISSIFKAYQLPALGDLFLPIGSLISLVTIILLEKFTDASIFYAILSNIVPTLFTVLIMNLYFFKFRFKSIRPSFAYFDYEKLKEVFSLGVKFFYLQLMGMIMYSFSNLIILHYVGAEEVTKFAIANKLVLTFYMFFSFILTPFWTGFTDAYHKADYKWIKSSIKKLLRLTLYFTFILTLLVSVSSFIFKGWIGDRVNIPIWLTVVIAIQQIVVAYSTVFGLFINGVGKLKVSIIFMTLAVIFFIPTVIYFTKLFGAGGYVLTLILVNYLPALFVYRYQYNLIINNNAVGVWNQ